MKRYIAVDSGKSSTKVAELIMNGKNQDEVIEISKFRTRIGEGTFDDDNPGNNTFIMEYDGKTYKIGKNADSDAELDTSKKTLTHKICTLYAIANICSAKEVDEVYAAIGIPVKDWENVNIRNEYRSYILPEGEISVKYKKSGDGPIVEKTFKIAGRYVYPETLGALFIGNNINTGTVGVIDIGHLNVNQTIYNNIDVDKEYSMTDTLGGNALVTGLAQTLSAQFGFINPKQTADILLKQNENRCLMPKRLNEQNKDVPKKSKEVIDRFLKKHVEGILDHCKIAQWSVDYMDFIFIGGTSIILKKEIQEVFGDDVVIPENPEYANVIGFLRIMCGKSLGREITTKVARKKLAA